ncbi:unnamed protein product [Peniophora sp. CBMAI 1063]|nr:unnamed protein product [Peniophora sp. CBMAI 1063]
MDNLRPVVYPAVAPEPTAPGIRGDTALFAPSFTCVDRTLIEPLRPIPTNGVHDAFEVLALMILKTMEHRVASKSDAWVSDRTFASPGMSDRVARRLYSLTKDYHVVPWRVPSLECLARPSRSLGHPCKRRSCYSGQTFLMPVRETSGSQSLLREVLATRGYGARRRGLRL